jgi:dihydrodipicolinate reductase
VYGVVGHVIDGGVHIVVGTTAVEAGCVAGVGATTLVADVVIATEVVVGVGAAFSVAEEAGCEAIECCT